MAVTIQKIEKLKKGDYIEASEIYYKVIKVDTVRKKLVLTKPFSKGYKAEGNWSSSYVDDIAKQDQLYWKIIRKNSKESEGIEGKLK